MLEQNIYNEINSLIERKEINKSVRNLQDNSETLETYWNIGRLIVEAQGGESKAKYGDNLIKNWSEKLSNLYGKKYGISSLKYMRQFYLTFPIRQSVIDQLTWTHFLQILP